MVWFYNQTDVVYVPSRATGEELSEKGIPQEKIKFYPRGIDIERFHPSKANGFFHGRLRVIRKEIKLLYVGRVSREKNLPELVEVFKDLAALRTAVRLVVVGEGPYLEEMKRALDGLAGHVHRIPGRRGSVPGLCVERHLSVSLDHGHLR